MKGGFRRGVSPLIATILLLLLAMVGAALMWENVASIWSVSEAPLQEGSEEMINCSLASLVVYKDEEHCTYYPSTGQTKIIIENSGETDLNTFNIISSWKDGSSDLNKVGLDLEEHETGIGWSSAKVPAEMPIVISVESVECSQAKTSIKPAKHCKIGD